MATTVGDREVRPQTADEVMRMVDAGILVSGERVELLDGLLTEMPVKGPPHAMVEAGLLAWLAPVIRRYVVRAGSPLMVPQPTWLPEPDLATLFADL